MTMPSKIWAKKTTGWGGLVGGQFRNHPVDDATQYIRADLAEELARALTIIKQLCNPDGDIQYLADAALSRYNEATKCSQ